MQAGCNPGSGNMIHIARRMITAAGTSRASKGSMPRDGVKASAIVVFYEHCPVFAGIKHFAIDSHPMIWSGVVAKIQALRKRCVFSPLGGARDRRGFFDWAGGAGCMLDNLLGTNETTAAAAAVLGLLVLAILLKGSGGLRGTTLVAPWAWSALATLTVAGSEVAAGLAGDLASWIVPLRFMAAMSAFCPIMAVLGAKRPQDRAWQFIVLSLWAVLCLPAAGWWLFGAAGPQEDRK